MTVQQDLPAGAFSPWLRRTRDVLATDGTADVPCGSCTACCTSSYFVHVGSHETQTLARIPEELLFAAPGLPKGTVVMGYDRHGLCPLLIDEKCSIYGQHPLTCRSYDCRVFAAAGIAADRDLITQRARRWRFGYPSASDREQHAAVRAAARFLRERAECFPGGAVPENPAQVAVLAVKVSDVFLRHGDGSGATGRAPSDLELAKAVMTANEEFEAARDARGAPPT